MGGGWTTKVVLEKGGGGGSGRAVVGVGLQASLGVRWGEGGKVYTRYVETGGYGCEKSLVIGE